MNEHDRELASAFRFAGPEIRAGPRADRPGGGQALVRKADLPPRGLVLDAGCGRGWSPRRCWPRACGEPTRLSIAEGRRRCSKGVTSSRTSCRVRYATELVPAELG